jgi:DNA-binding response OmpR family regulator
MGAAKDKKHILIVDDDELLCETFVDFMNFVYNDRIILTVGHDGDEALQLIAKKAPDLLILGVRMPRMSGVEVVKNIVDQGLDFPIIIMSGQMSKEIVDEVSAILPEERRLFLIKPFHPDELTAAVGRFLRIK